MNHIIKIGLALLRRDHILLVRKRGSMFFILPGGKPEAGESDLVALCRELEEELGCALDLSTVRHLGTFSDRAAGSADTSVTVKLYSGNLIGTPIPQAEIETMAWVPLGDYSKVSLAPSLRNSILPSLREGYHSRELCG